MKSRVLISVATVMCWTVMPVRATTLVRMSLNQLAQASKTIVRGRVINQESRWNAQHTQIITLTTVALGQTLKGDAAETLVIEQMGGVVGHIRSWVPGTALLRPQAEYVFFLQPSATNPSRHLLVGMMQGAFRVYRDAQTRQERVVLPTGSMLSGQAPAPQASGTLAGPTMPYQAFRQAITTSVNAPLAIPSGLTIPVEIRSASFQGVGRMDIEGRVTSDLFPNHGVVIPAGSAIYGAAEREGNTWHIHWTEISTRGGRAPISALSEESADGSLRGRVLVVTVR